MPVASWNPLHLLNQVRDVIRIRHYRPVPNRRMCNGSDALSCFMANATRKPHMQAASTDADSGTTLVHVFFNGTAGLRAPPDR